MIEKWYLEQPVAAQAAFDSVKEFLEQRERQEWRRPDFDLLSGKRYRVLGEMRFKSQGIQYRPLGFFGPARHEFTLLVGAIKKSSNYDPREAIETALERRDEVMTNPKRSKVCEF